MDLQNYPRSRKSKRIQQPEALDSKTCSTFPEIAGSSFVRMSDVLALPLQLLNYFFVSKCLIERPAQHIVTAASGPRAEALALVLPDSESYLHFEHCIWMTSESIEPSRLWESVGLGDKGGLS